MLLKVYMCKDSIAVINVVV